MSAAGDAAKKAPPGAVDAALAALPDAEQVAIVEAWIKEGDGARVAAVAAGEGAGKNARKAAKKGVHVLKARGVAVAEPARAAVAVPAPAPSSESRGYMTMVDPSGVQILLHVHSARGGGLQGAQAVAQRGKGLVDGGAVHLSRKELRVHLDRLVEDGVRFYDVPADHARARIATLVDAARDAGRPLPESLLAVEIHLPPHTPPAGHPLEARLPRAERAKGRVTEAELAFFETVPLLASWGPDEDAIHVLLERMNAAAGGGVLVLSEAQKSDAAEEAFGKTIDDDFGDRASWSIDLMDTAWCFLAEGDRATAELLARCADELDDVARPTRDLAFARWLWRHHLVAHAEHHHHGHEVGPGRTPPPEGEGEGEGSEPKRTPGGLYIP